MGSPSSHGELQYSGYVKGQGERGRMGRKQGPKKEFTVMSVYGHGRVCARVWVRAPRRVPGEQLRVRYKLGPPLPPSCAESPSAANLF